MSFFGEKITNEKFSIVSQNRGLTPWKNTIFRLYNMDKRLVIQNKVKCNFTSFFDQKTNKNVFEKNVFDDIL